MLAPGAAGIPILLSEYPNGKPTHDDGLPQVNFLIIRSLLEAIQHVNPTLQMSEVGLKHCTPGSSGIIGTD